MKHFRETELLEAWYIPGGDVEMTRHLETCSDCRDRLARLGAELSAAAANAPAPLRSAEFYGKQRRAIFDAIDGRQPARWWEALLAPARQFGFAAALLLALSGAWMLNVARWGDSAAPAPITLADATTERLLDDIDSIREPWESDELQPFQNMVAWESWIAAEPPHGGTS
jgi:hypothetical protein